VKYRLRFRKEVPDDIVDACRWYEGRQGSGLRNRFLRELKGALARIVSTPESFAKGERDVRTARLHRFPYLVHYRLTGATVEVIAVMYGGRDSSMWIERT
jgi:plasmid stabilization system protein ParE